MPSEAADPHTVWWFSWDPVTGVHNDADDWTDDNSDYIDDCDDGFTKDAVETVTHNKKAACILIFDQHFQQQVFGHFPKVVKLEWSNKNAKKKKKKKKRCQMNILGPRHLRVFPLQLFKRTF